LEFNIIMSKSFADFGVPDDLARVLSQAGIESPFPIQAATLTDALEGRDVCGQAPTGSGKTLAFAIPVVDRATKAKSRRPTALVVAPTRELVSQISDVLAPLAAVRGLRTAVVIGGVGFGPQIGALDRGVDILVATPGRLEDLIEKRCVDLRDVSIVVVDEADRMADMGFLPAVKRLLDATDPARQTILFSATLVGPVEELIRGYQRRPSRHVMEVAVEGEPARHVFWVTPASERVALVASVVQRTGSTVVFCRTKFGADRVAKQLAAHGVKAAALHGGRSQAQREQALEEFRNGHAQVLVATDVAARGIHVDDVATVIQLDPPAALTDHTHRSGRTARAGQTGTVISLATPDTVRAATKMFRALAEFDRFEKPNVMILNEGEARAVTPMARSKAKPDRLARQRSHDKPKPDGPRRERSDRDRAPRGESNDRPARRDNNDRPVRSGPTDWPARTAPTEKATENRGRPMRNEAARSKKPEFDGRSSRGDYSARAPRVDRNGRPDSGRPARAPGAPNGAAPSRGKAPSSRPQGPKSKGPRGPR
jgi:superfamily II DNA/RNA helicase